MNAPSNALLRRGLESFRGLREVPKRGLDVLGAVHGERVATKSSDDASDVCCDDLQRGAVEDSVLFVVC